MAQAAYDFSLFEKYGYGTAAPELVPEYRSEKPIEFPTEKKNTSAGTKKNTFIYVKSSTKASLLRSLSIVAVAAVIFGFMFGVMSLNASLDKTAKDIVVVENEIKIAKNEQIKLNSQLNNMVSFNNIKNYAENTLGMIHIESSKITYIETETENYVALSGGKSYYSATEN